MSQYQAPLAEMQFVMTELAGLDEIATLPGYTDATPDTVAAILEGYPTQEVLRQNEQLPTPRTPLSFPSIVAESTNDPLGRYERVVELAAAWGSRLVNVGAVGHLNPASGFGEWARAEELIRELL